MHSRFPSGANLRTCQIGIFPLAHVVDVDYAEFDPGGASGAASEGGPASASGGASTEDERRERYNLQYIGSVESGLYKGNAVLYQVRSKII